MEIITGVERRRRWRLEEKHRVLVEVQQPCASFAGVAGMSSWKIHRVSCLPALVRLPR